MKNYSKKILSVILAIILTMTVLPINLVFNASALEQTASSVTSVTSITLSKTSANMTIGNVLLLTAAVSPVNASNKAVAWSSSNTAVVATVLSSGLVIAKSIGTAKITCAAKDGSGVSATCTIKVIPATPDSFVVARASSTSVVVSWQAVIGATGYEIYRYSPLFGKYVLIKITSSTSFVNSWLSKDKAYSYKVRAFKLVGLTFYYSEFTAEKSA
jgi:hypothetical protein